MASALQIQANRQNSRKCRGPITPAGKARSSMNALKTGIDAKSELLPNENPAERKDLAARYHLSLVPATPEESDLVNAMIQSAWLSRRYARIEAAVWNGELDSMDSPCTGAAFMAVSIKICRVGRRQTAAQREFHRAAKQLRTGRHVASKPLNTKLVSFRTFTKPAQAPRPTRRIEPRMRC